MKSDQHLAMRKEALLRDINHIVLYGTDEQIEALKKIISVCQRYLDLKNKGHVVAIKGHLVSIGGVKGTNP